jgi:hypothetical protein
MDHFKRRDFIKLSALGFGSVVLHLRSLSTYAQQANGHLGRWNANTPYRVMLDPSLTGTNVRLDAADGYVNILLRSIPEVRKD